MHQTEQPPRLRQRPLRQTLFLDLFFDPRTRPIFIYALVVVGIGAAVYRWLEGWNWTDSFYFVIITLTTIGYGDLHPTQPITKIITIFYGLNGVVLLLMLFDVIRTVRGWEIPDAQRQVERRDDEG